jgi:6-pyruvoyltetrahydropterin/6-carboxytetrahydropterin synthase
MTTITKLWPEIPFAHRQPSHKGHCRFIHGHNWSFAITFAASVMDDNNFVIDFGSLKFVRDWLEGTFDHACVLPDSDPLRSSIVKHNEVSGGLFKLVFVPDASSEGLAKYVHEFVNNRVKQVTNGRVWVQSVTVHEDSRNSATYSVGV